MRSLYWLTAITLVAAAVTTVAIADYGRRHPQGFAGLWSNQRVPVTVNQTGQPAPRNQEPSPPPPSLPITLPSTGSPPQSPSCCPPAPIQNLTETASSVPVVQLPAIPSQANETPSIRLEDVPEHQTLRKKALQNLASMQEDVPALPVPTPTKPPEVVQTDEFSFPGKPLAPLYVPLRPDAPVVMPPPKVMQEVAKLPTIPGVSAGQQSLARVPEFKIDAPRGPEVLPGLHAVPPPVNEEDNPVQQTMLALGELIAAVNPTTYLMALPLDKRTNKPVTSFATVEPATPVASVTPVCEEKTACPTTPSTCSKEGTCCKAGSGCDEIVVRTYSVAEFTSTAGTNHDELIRLITTMISPEGWCSKDSTIEYFAMGKCLVVRHRTSVQTQVEDLLTQLRGQVVKQTKGVAGLPLIRHEATMTVPTELELVPVCPKENGERSPRIITNESNRCVGDDDFFGMIPMTLDGRLMPVPMTLPRIESSSLVPAQFTEEGPAVKTVKSRAPEFFPWFLPYAPLPNGPDSCEEDRLKQVGYVDFSDYEIDMIFLEACEWEEARK